MAVALKPVEQKNRCSKLPVKKVVFNKKKGREENAIDNFEQV